jgi:hypothetical protein
MKTFLLFTALIFPLLIAGETVKKNTTHAPYYGPTEINNKTVEQLTIYGPAFIKNTQVKEKAILKGPVNAQGSTFNDIQVDGIAKFEDVKVNQLSVNGPLAAVNSTLNEITIASNELSLMGTNVNRLMVKTNHFTFGKQTVYLDKESKVEHLSFESGKGVVILEDAASSVTKLEGGELRRE